jgi:hypothetical protein
MLGSGPCSGGQPAVLNMWAMECHCKYDLDPVDKLTSDTYDINACILIPVVLA